MKGQGLQAPLSERMDGTLKTSMPSMGAHSRRLSTRNTPLSYRKADKQLKWADHIEPANKLATSLPLVTATSCAVHRSLSLVRSSTPTVFLPMPAIVRCVRVCTVSEQHTRLHGDKRSRCEDHAREPWEHARDRKHEQLRTEKTAIPAGGLYVDCHHQTPPGTQSMPGVLRRAVYGPSSHHP